MYTAATANSSSIAHFIVVSLLALLALLGLAGLLLNLQQWREQSAKLAGTLRRIQQWRALNAEWITVIDGYMKAEREFHSPAALDELRKGRERLAMRDQLTAQPTTESDTSAALEQVQNILQDAAFRLRRAAWCEARAGGRPEATDG